MVFPKDSKEDTVVGTLKMKPRALYQRNDVSRATFPLHPKLTGMSTHLFQRLPME